MSYEAVRKDYVKHVLEESDCLENPIEMLENWLNEALKETQDANAMTLTTVSAEGKPSSRVVLIRKLDERGVIFYSNYSSKKASELKENPNAAVNFFWPWVERQVRVEGTVIKLPEAESDAYFKSRPRESQIGAWASDQSDEMTSRDQLEKRFQEVTQKFENKDVPRPEFWGGYIIQPSLIEFWQGRASRLHDRIKYEPFENRWKFKRLFP
ncbi:pyridoxamine 5'-phosphate oxidase [Salibacteraceae bacterium]|jgi:pyridoxamine 5'-phosphate oxidase|nr:pyridoxamine 5'-phosphate oxidase [Salibacteraceae bacterium]MDB4104536.1 pyridoxamine 5'-phosphate oxidase [Salibacteraceae bacterium]